MRTKNEFQEKEILATWAKGCVPYTSDVYNTTFINAIKQTKMGKNGEKRDFLVANDKETQITQGGNNVRRSCTVVVLESYHKS